MGSSISFTYRIADGNSDKYSIGTAITESFDDNTNHPDLFAYSVTEYIGTFTINSPAINYSNNFGKFDDGAIILSFSRTIFQNTHTDAKRCSNAYSHITAYD